MKIKSVLVVIPAYNEETSIGNVLSEVRVSFPEADVMVVNDGSTDGTSAVARRAGGNVVDLPFNMGIGVAIQTGFIYAWKRGYDAVIRIDSDGQHRPAELRHLLAPIEEGAADIVVGSRFLKGEGSPVPAESETEEHRPGLARMLGIGLFSGLLRLLLGYNVTDPTSGLQAMNRKALGLFAREYPSAYPEIDAHILAYKAGLKVKELPASFRRRSGGESSIAFLISIYIVLESLVFTFVGMFRRVKR